MARTITAGWLAVTVVDAPRNGRSDMWLNGIHLWRSLAFPLVASLLAVCLGSASAEPGVSSADALSQEEVAREREALLQLMSAARSPAASVALEIDVTGAARLGSAEAPLVLIEFSDYECGFCRRHQFTVMPALIEEYLDTGRVLYVFMEFPVVERSPQAFSAANAARCAGDQGRYQDMRESLYRNPYSLDPAGLGAQGIALGLEPATYTACVEALAHEETIRAHMALGQRLGVRGTPFFFLGQWGDDDGHVHAHRRIAGAQPLALFRTEVDTALKAQTALSSDAAGLAQGPP
jgi:protein-disulfide isomerase